MSTVTGFTTINHRIRTELKLTTSAYIIADYLHSICKDGIVKEFPTSETMFLFTGCGKEEIAYAINELVIRMIITTNGNSATLLPKWLDYFDTDAEFEKLWTLWLKKGNKAKALKNYKAVRKTVAYEVLSKAAEAYMASKKDSERQFIKGFEVWLNPVNKHWEDVIVSPVQAKEPYKFVKH